MELPPKSKRVLTIRLKRAKNAALMAKRELAVCSSHVPAPCKERVALQAEATKVPSFSLRRPEAKTPAERALKARLAEAAVCWLS